MTKKFTRTKHSMALDLDSFLNSHSTSDDDDTDLVPHRTLDEILNDSDSSTPPSSPPRLSNFLHRQRPSDLPRPQNDGALESSTDSKSIVLDDKLENSRSASFARHNSDPIWKVSSSTSRPLPSLFGGVRSNVKPGAALAAAAAASRSVPTPHAAAIKSRRAGGVLLKAADAGESVTTGSDDHDLVSDSSNGDSVGVIDTGRTLSGDKLLDGSNSNAHDPQSTAENEALRMNDNMVNSTEAFDDVKDVGGGLEPVVVIEKLGFNDDGGAVLSTDASISDSVAKEGENVGNNSKISDRMDIDSPAGFGMDEKNEEGSLTMPPLESNDLDNTGDDCDGGDSRDDYDGGEGGSDGSSLTDISDMVEERIEQLESEIISKRMEKKLHKPMMKPLELAEKLEKKQAYTGLHMEEGAAAQPMRLEGVRRESTTLGYFHTDAGNAITGIISSQAFMRDHGSPQVLAVHVNYIAVGMSKGVIIVVPSRYSLQNGDNMDSKMLILGLQGDRSHASVTSMCFNQQGDLLLAGYGDGHITVWDVQRASAVKVITGEHTAPVVHTLFLGQDFQVTRQFKAVSGDSKGLVLLHAFSAVPLLNRFTIKTQCLLDGQRTGTVLSASPLLFDESCGSALASHQGNGATSSSGIGSMMGGVVGGDNGWKLFNEGSSLVEEGVVIFATHQTALVVRLTPTLQVYAQLSKPDGVREGSMPYTAWKCTTESRSSSTENTPGDGVERVSLLAVAWDRKVQVAKLVKSELKVYGKWSLDSAAIGVAWLDDHMLVVLTIAGQLFLFAKDGTVIHQTSFAVDGSRGDDLVTYHTQFINIYGNPEKAYHNSVAVRGASVYILGHTQLIVSRLLPWKERIQVLRGAGDWMGALNMSMTLFDGQAHGVVDLPKSVNAVREAIMPYLVELILSYADEVFSYISVAFSYQIGKADQEGDSKSESSSVQSEIKEQLTRVGGVAVEFCVHIQRTDILFDEIFSKFVAVQQKDTFLELLEQYILRDMLGSLPPEIMQALVEHYSSKGWLQRVEQCVLHMDISSLDFNQVVRLCREHGLYGALIYLFNKGLDDFRAPLEELLVVSRNSDKEKAASLGYKMLVYLKYCFSGLAFPPGHGDLPPTRLPSLRAELVQFLLEHSDAQTSQVTSSPLPRRTYLNLHQLLELDTEATLDVLRWAFDGGENSKLDLSSHEVVDVRMESIQEKNVMAQSQNPLVQNTIDALIQAIEEHTSQADPSANSDDTLAEEWPSEKDVGHLFEFIAYHVACRKASVSNSVLMQILKYLTSVDPSSPSLPTSPKKREKQVLALLDAVSETDWDVMCVLQLCEQAHFHQVCGLIHTIRHQYVAALDCYMKDVDEPIHTFSYIDNMLQKLSHDESHVFRSAIMSRIPELLILNRDATFFVVFNNFGLESTNILSELRTHPKSLFLYLKTAVEVYLSGSLNFSYLQKEDDEHVSSERMYHSEIVEAYLEKISEFPKFIRNNPVHVTDDMIDLYFELLCQYERNSVLKFLETFDSYRVEHCLRLCQEYRIIDAAAFLMERVGDVGNALLLTLSGLEDKFSELDIAVRRIVSNKAFKGSANLDYYTTALKLKEVDDISSILHACIELCKRNSPRLQLEESELLWFRLLDSFCGPLMDSRVDKVSNEKNRGGMLAETLVSHDGDEPFVIKWKISRSHKGAHILRKLFSLFIKDIVEGMIGYIHLPTIMSKLLSANGGQEFGDFKMTILGMLGTYGFERRILDTAKSLIEDDTFYTMHLLKKGSSHGYAPQSVVCCICNCPLAKSSSRIRVFSCGHASHVDCELLESESSTRDYFSGCPVCMPKKNAQKPKNKSALPKTILVNNDSSRYQRALGNGMLRPHEDSFENSYGPHQMSRFEILANLQKDQKHRVVQIENMPQLKLAPPAVYHEKVKKGLYYLPGETSSELSSTENQTKSRQIKEIKLKGASLRFPLKTSIFGKEKASDSTFFLYRLTGDNR